MRARLLPHQHKQYQVLTLFQKVLRIYITLHLDLILALEQRRLTIFQRVLQISIILLLAQMLILTLDLQQNLRQTYQRERTYIILRLDLILHSELNQLQT